jgi:segregation and condensation protein B
MNLESKIEALLFYRAEPTSIKKLAELLHEKEDAIRSALLTLSEKKKEGGLVIMKKEDEVTLATHPDMAGTLSNIAKEETSGPLSRAALETLSITLYMGPISKPQIDYIRGVNSHFILRHLLIRGLVEKIPHPQDGRTFLYKTTFDLLSYLGVPKAEDLPGYSEFKEKLSKIESNQKEDGRRDVQ